MSEPYTRCQICDSTTDVAEMTDGKFSAHFCRSCGNMVSMFFQIYESLEVAYFQVKQAKRGRIECK